MHYRSEFFGSVLPFRGHRGLGPISVCTRALVLTVAICACACTATAQDMSMPAAMDSPADASSAPMMQSGGGDVAYFSQNLDTLVRLRYSTESYGQDGTGNF